MICQIINSNRKLEKFIKQNFDICFIKVVEDKQNLEGLSELFNKQSKKLISNIASYSFIDFYANSFKNQTLPQKVLINELIEKTKNKILYIYNGENDGVIADLGNRFDIKYICINLDNEKSKSKFIDFFSKYKKDDIKD